MLHGLAGGNVFAAFADGHHQFDFMVEIARHAGIRDVPSHALRHHHQGIGGFQKEKWGFTAGVTHFLGVLFIVAPHAINAMNRK